MNYITNYKYKWQDSYSERDKISTDNKRFIEKNI
jgi:hypothetical protein